MADEGEPRQWVVGGAVIESDAGILLVQNRRRNGRVDWSPPGGVIDEGETLLEGLTREVREETGLRVTEWVGPVYEIHALAPGLGWELRVEAWVATAFDGDLEIDDPDGIVVDARFVALDACHEQLEQCHPWVREPLAEWLTDRWSHLEPPRPYGYRVDGADLATLMVTRLH
jgi:8-oxo-dGTP diphosphatase